MYRLVFFWKRKVRPGYGVNRFAGRTQAINAAAAYFGTVPTLLAVGIERVTP
jgi:hypothetical protein